MENTGFVNPYVSFAIAMCVVIFLSLFITAYLAMTFNRRAKADLGQALGSLTEVIDGEVDVEQASVNGRYEGHLAEGRMANAEEGPGRVFQTSIVDAAGGAAWARSSTPAKQPGEHPRIEFVTADPDVASNLSVPWDRLLLSALIQETDRYRIDYDPTAGRLRFQRPMRTRRDIPDAATFRRQLDLLVTIGPMNRRAQGAPDADWAGGRRQEDAGHPHEGG